MLERTTPRCLSGAVLTAMQRASFVEPGLSAWFDESGFDESGLIRLI
jgi:hypothetical protein